MIMVFFGPSRIHYDHVQGRRHGLKQDRKGISLFLPEGQDRMGRKAFAGSIVTHQVPGLCGFAPGKIPPLQSCLEKAMAPHSSTLAWQIPWTEEPGSLQSMGSLGVGHD